MVLRTMNYADESTCLAAHAELSPEGFDFLWGYELSMVWDEYLAMIEDYAQGRNVPEDRVPAAVLLADVDGAVVGRISVRFELNDFLLKRGGHIGYAVRPAYRRRGYATEILRLGLQIARDRGIDPVLLTCLDANVASARVIERAGGDLESIFVDDDGTRIRRYWIANPAEPGTPTAPG